MSENHYRCQIPVYHNTKINDRDWGEWDVYAVLDDLCTALSEQLKVINVLGPTVYLQNEEGDMDIEIRLRS